jgi:hypothetical protein
MPTSFGALCSDFYINQKLALKMDLPSERETILHFFDRMRKSLPTMDRFKRYDGELALESARKDSTYHWLALRRNSIRTGHVNPSSIDSAIDYHRLILEVAPYHLTISPLDVDYLEVMYGFDLECKQNHDAVIFNALFADSPLGRLMPEDDKRVLDVQPVFGSSLTDEGDVQAYFEVKSRPKSRRGSSKRYAGEPISLFLSVRKYGPVDDLKHLTRLVGELNAHCEELATEKLVPDLLNPIARAITSTP